MNPRVTIRYGEQCLHGEVARGWCARTFGLLTGAPRLLVLPRTCAVHSFGMRHDIEVWFVDSTQTVVAVTLLRPWRVAMRWRAHTVIERPPGRPEPPQPGTRVTWS